MSSNKLFSKNWIATFWIAVSLTLVGGCASDSERSLETLDKTIRIYNNAFESKVEDGGSAYVQNDFRMDYLLKYGEIQNRVSFFQAQTLNIAYFKGGKPLEINIEDPEEDPEKLIDEAVITMRYKVAISPSNRLKTFIHEQRWKREGITWRLEPNLKPFVN
jgi:hypothetical protein